jgi:hypothetical protein
MTKEQAKEFLDLQLTAEQLEEVRRRRTKQNPTYVSLADARRRLGCPAPAGDDSADR